MAGSSSTTSMARSDRASKVVGRRVLVHIAGQTSCKTAPNASGCGSPSSLVPTRNRYDILAEHIRPAASVTRVDTPEDYPITLFIKPTKLSKKRRGNKSVSGPTLSISANSVTSDLFCVQNIILGHK